MLGRAGFDDGSTSRTSNIDTSIYSIHMICILQRKYDTSFFHDTIFRLVQIIMSSRIDFDLLKSTIAKAKTIEQFVNLFDNDDAFKAALKAIRDFLGDESTIVSMMKRGMGFALITGYFVDRSRELINGQSG